MTAIPPRKAVQVRVPFESNGIWIAMYQLDSECIPYAVEVSKPTEDGEIS